jgi:hypothetical protein
MTRGLFSFFLLVGLALVLPSCSGTGEGLVSVSGKLVCDGQPAEGAILVFHRVSSEPAPAKAAAGGIPSATVGSDGTFSVESAALGRGAAPGKYNVLIEWPQQTDAAPVAASKTKSSSVRGKTMVVAKHEKFDAMPADRLMGRYSNLSKPQLTAEVKSGPTDLGTLEITMK